MTRSRNLGTPATQAEAEAGTETEVRAFSPARVKEAIDALATGAPEGTAVVSTGETAGKVLTADGDNTSSWQTVDGLPDQTGHNGQYLQSDGTNADWADTPAHEGTEVLSTGVTDGFVLTADGVGGSAWEAATGGGGAAVEGQTAPRACRTYLSASQAISSTLSKIELDSIDFDTGGDFDTINNRFQPSVAGYYHIKFSGDLELGGVYIVWQIRKNTTVIAQNREQDETQWTHGDVSTLVYLNGSSDYIEIWGRSESSTPNIRGGETTLTYFEAHQLGTSLSTASAPRVCSVAPDGTQTLTDAVNAVIEFDTINFDTGGDFDLTNDRFQPSVAGYYDIFASINADATATVSSMLLYIYKNGVATAFTSEIGSSTAIHRDTVHDKLYLNGSTDYVDIRATVNGSNATVQSTSTFTAHLITGDQVQGARTGKVTLSADQNINGDTWTRIDFDTIDFDTDNDWDNTNKRFQPSVPGYYQLTNHTRISNNTTTSTGINSIYFNGSPIIYGADRQVSSSVTTWHVECTTILYFNGTTDYAEFYAFASGTVGDITTSNTEAHWFLIPSTSGTPGITTNATGEAIIIDENNNVEITGDLITRDQIATSPFICTARLTSNQTFTGNQYVKVLLDTTNIDTHGSFDLTNNRFQPSQAGYYNISAAASMDVTSALYDAGFCIIYKNGEEVARSADREQNIDTVYYLNCDTIVFLDGIDDYVELYIYAVGDTTTTNLIKATQTGGGAATYYPTELKATLITSPVSTMSAPRVCKVHKNAVDQTGLVSNIDTLCTFSTADFDTGGDFDLTNNRFQPKQAGYYKLNFSAGTGPDTTANMTLVRLKKNGTTWISDGRDAAENTVSSAFRNVNTSTVEYMNGSTDYVDCHVRLGNGGGRIEGDTNHTHFEANLITGDQVQGARVCNISLSANQAVSAATTTIVEYDTVEFDSAGDFDTTNNKFQPAIPGYYYVTNNVLLSSPQATVDVLSATLYLNGTAGTLLAQSSDRAIDTLFSGNLSASALVYLNGTTDYIQAGVYSTGGTCNVDASSRTSFSAFLVPSTSGTPGITTNATGEAIIIDSNNDVEIVNKVKLGDYTFEEDVSGNLVISHLTTKVMKLYENGDLDIAGSINTSQTIT